MNEALLNKLFLHVASDRFNSACKGFSDGWRWDCSEHREDFLQGVVTEKPGWCYRVTIEQKEDLSGVASCNCRNDWRRRKKHRRGKLCEHVVFAVLAELMASGVYPAAFWVTFGMVLADGKHIRNLWTVAERMTRLPDNPSVGLLKGLFGR